MSQKYVVVSFVEPQNAPLDFAASQWPLHVTLLANFTIAQPLERLIDDLALFAQATRPFDIRAGEDAMFGPTGNITVTLITPSQDIINAHNKLISITEGLGATYDEPEFNGAGYRPHATIRGSSRLRNKQQVMVNSFSLVDMFPKKNINQRNILKTFQFTQFVTITA